MRILMITLLGMGLGGCGQIQEDLQNWMAGFQGEIMLVKMQGEPPKVPDSYHLNKIKQGVNELREMNDPKIAYIYRLINNKIKDSDLSSHDYHIITLAIHQHKQAIQQKSLAQKNAAN